MIEFDDVEWTSKLYVGLSSIEIDDFSIIGGPDFTFLPWPETTPTISGISKESNYYNSLNTVIDQNKFGEGDVGNYQQAIQASENDELGDFLISANEYLRSREDLGIPNNETESSIEDLLSEVEETSDDSNANLSNP